MAWGISEAPACTSATSKSFALLQNVGGTPDSIEAVLKEVDKDGDGKIDYDEFVQMMREGGSTDGATQNQLKSLKSAKSKRRAY